MIAIGAAGIAWLLLSVNWLRSSGEGATLCLIKRCTGVPCPSCGSTRSVMEIFHGNFLNATLTNPLGWILIVMIIVFPVWILTDAVKRKPQLYQTTQRFLEKLREPRVALFFILLLAANWIWNIVKGL